jgi:hypothetical protein
MSWITMNLWIGNIINWYSSEDGGFEPLVGSNQRQLNG